MRTILIIAGLALLMSATQSPFTARVQAQERLRVVIEEVRLPVAGFDKYGHFDPTLTNDLRNSLGRQLAALNDGPDTSIVTICANLAVNISAASPNAVARGECRR